MDEPEPWMVADLIAAPGPFRGLPTGLIAQVETSLSRHERHARTLDRASLAECLIFGECSTRARTVENS